MRRELVHPVSLLFVVAVLATPLFAQLPAGWTSSGIGNPAAAGSAQYNTTTEAWTIRGDGTGIRGTADQFHFVYKTLNGDGEMVARVVSLDGPLSDWSMAGVMIRVLLIPGSPYIFMGVSANTDTRDHGITMWGREALNGLADHESTGATGAPCWVKVKRTGDTFAAYSSFDGKEWTERYSTTAAGIPKSTYIGYAVTSDAGGKLVTAVFDRGPAEASSPEPRDGAQNVAAPLFRWTAGINAAAHDVYLGTNPTPGPAEYIARLPGTQTVYFHTPGLEPGTTYYWRIDEVGADGTTIYTGDVWHFTSAPATAYAPQPWDGLDGVDVETDLAWTMGVNAFSHDVYFGTDKAAVAAGDPATFQGNRPMPTCALDTLAENTTYYWRVDERDEAGAVQPGPVWSFGTIGPHVGVKAEYFQGLNLTGAPVLTRTEPLVDHDWGGSEVAAGLSDSLSARWTADLKAPFTETCQFITTTDDGVRLWLDGRLLIDNWTNHGSTDDVATAQLVAGQFYRLEMEWYENTGSAVARLSWQSPSIDRQVIPGGVLQLPLHATDPYPAHPAVDVTQTLTLHWTGGDKATGHDVYFGMDADAVANATTSSADIYEETVSAPTFDPGPLEWNQTYYWRVDEVYANQPDHPRTGSLWSFTTADFLVVDDFESYTDEDGNRIFQTWTDDWAAISTGGGCGATVGYGQAPFAEQTIVHGGRQSLPLDYNNVCAPYYSQTEREFAPVQNWTVNGVATLVLHIRGKADNDAAPLYVRIEDNAGKTCLVTHPDAAIAQTMNWTPWEIPLSELSAAGVNVAKIKKMSLGLGDTAHPSSGGHGLIFVDDIRVIKP
jgi:hypothetical protein